MLDAGYPVATCRFFETAPGHVTLGRVVVLPEYRGRKLGTMDASIVTTSMMMQATDLGLATLWARGFNASYIESAFEFPDNLKLACLLDIGYADPENGGPSPRHPVRKSMEEFVSEI